MSPSPRGIVSAEESEAPAVPEAPEPLAQKPVGNALGGLRLRQKWERPRSIFPNRSMRSWNPWPIKAAKKASSGRGWVKPCELRYA